MRRLSTVARFVTPDGEWAPVIDRVSEQIETGASGSFEAGQISLFAAQEEPELGTSPLSALKYRVLSLILLGTTLRVVQIQGAVDGFLDSWNADKAAVAALSLAARDPIATARAIAAVMKEIGASIPEIARGSVHLLMSAPGLVPVDQPLVLAANGAYYSGYIVGVLVEQALVTALLTAAGAVTANAVGAAAGVAASRVVKMQWLVVVSTRALRMVRSMVYWAEAFARAGASTAAARAAFGALYRSRAILDDIWTKYPAASVLVRRHRARDADDRVTRAAAVRHRRANGDHGDVQPDERRGGLRGAAHAGPRPHRMNGDLTASFPIVPSRTFAVTELASGTVHLDILAGRETVRGVAGGSEPVSLTSGEAILKVARGALPEDTAVAFQSVLLSSFLPSAPDLTPIAEFSIDFSGRTLAVTAELSVPAAAVAPYDAAIDTLLVARVERISGIPRLVVVSLAAVTDGRVVSQPYAGLAGVTRGGRYVLYRAAMPIGFLAGVARVGDSPASAIVSTSTLLFVGVADLDGRYIVAARGGAVQATALVPGTSLSAQASTDAVARSTTTLDLTLSGAITTASVTPADGAVAVSPGAQIEIAMGNAFNAASVLPEQIQLLHLGSATAEPTGEGTPIPVRLVLSASGRTLALVPQARLEANARFRVRATGLTDVYGGAVIVPQATFVTKADEAPVYDVMKLVVSFPDADGFVTLRGPAGTLPPGSQVLVINRGSGEVSTFPVFNDGSTEGRFYAALTDRLQVTITDPLGNVTTFDP